LNKENKKLLEKSILLQKHFRYHLSEDFSSKRKLLIALHGYGQLALYFARKFKELPKDYALLVPEGMHRFYLEGSSGRVGASWMTKEWREQDIAENTRYLLQITAEIRSSNPTAQLTLLGFSQGGATAARLYQADPALFSQLILWASVFPPDIAMQQFPQGNKMDFVIGSNDPYFAAESKAKIQEEYLALGFDIHTFEGVHDLDLQMLLALLNQL
jgi:predicted esterase